jgi:O-antigen/teichoic acid export membrane protein
MSTVRVNILANVIGRAWTALIALAFVPIYLRLLGVDAYGLIGFFLTLQAVLGLFDLGLSLTLNRELARSSAAPGPVRLAPNLFRTMEIVYWFASIVIGAAVVVVAPVIASGWLDDTTLPRSSVEQALRLMGVVIALQMPLTLYQGGMMGLQRQVAANAILAVSATLRAAGAAAVLLLVAPAIEIFFAWQVVVSALTTGVFAVTLRRQLPHETFSGRFESGALRGLWAFSLAVSANAVVGVALTQLDKVILAKLVSLEQFGYYALAGTVASVIWAVVVPVNAALFPRFSQLNEIRNHQGLAALYHTACQVMAVAVLPVAVLLLFFPREILWLWTGNAPIAANAAMLVAMLAAGTALNGLTSVAAHLQSAAGWPGLVLKTNLVLAVALVPLLLVGIPRFGARAAAASWIAVNATYLLVTIPLMHRRLLQGQLGRWLVFDVLLPAGAALAVAVPARALLQATWHPVVQIVYIACVGLVCALAVIVVAPTVRHKATRLVEDTLARIQLRRVKTL